MFELRPYQKKVVNKLYSFFDSKTKSGLVVMPTAGGKTVTCIKGLYNWKARYSNLKVIWMAYNEHLLRQGIKTAKEFGFSTGIHCGTEKTVSPENNFIACSILSFDSLTARPAKNDPVIVVHDESHHSAADKALAVFEELDNTYPDIKFVGLTATPFRLDKKKLNFQKIIYQVSFSQVQKDGFLAEPKMFKIRTGIKKSLDYGGGDFTQKSLTALHTKDRALIVAKTYNKRQHHKTLIFLPNVKTCEIQKEAFKEVHPDLEVAVITGQTKSEVRSNIFERFENKDLDIIINVNVISEGIDLVKINTVFLARPTLSEGRYIQMIGRGARIHSNKKSFKVVDFIDDIAHYDHFTALWANKHFNKELPKDVKEKEELKATKEKIKEKFNKKRINGLVTEEHYLLLYSILTFYKQSRYKTAEKRYAITSFNYREVMSMITTLRLIQSQKSKKAAIDKLYSLVGHKVFDFYTCMSFCWAIVRGSYCIEEIRKMPEVDREAVLSAAKKELESFNKKGVRDIVRSPAFVNVLLKIKHSDKAVIFVKDRHFYVYVPGFWSDKNKYIYSNYFGSLVKHRYDEKVHFEITGNTNYIDSSADFLSISGVREGEEWKSTI